MFFSIIALIFTSKKQKNVWTSRSRCRSTACMLPEKEVGAASACFGSLLFVGLQASLKQTYTQKKTCFMMFYVI